MAKTKALSPIAVKARIVEIHGERVVVDSDLAAMSGVETWTLNQAVKRNRERFPGSSLRWKAPET